MAKCPMCGEDTFFAENAKKPYLSNWWGCGTCQDTLYTRRYTDRLEADVARKDAALRAADKALKPIADLQEKNIWRADFTQDAVDARALIAAALKEMAK